MQKQFGRSDKAQAFVLAVVASLAAAFIYDILRHAEFGHIDGQAQRNALLDFWLVHKPYINIAITAVTVIIYAILAFATRDHVRHAFTAWGIAWLIQLGSVYLRNVEPVGTDGFQFHTLLNALSTSALLYGALVIRRRRRWFMILLVLPLLGAAADVATRSAALTFLNFAVLTYFSLAILDHFRTVGWVPAYFAFGCYSLYASVQLLYILERYFEFAAGGAGARDVVEVLGYTVGAVAKGGGALGMLILGVCQPNCVNSPS